MKNSRHRCGASPLLEGLESRLLLSSVKPHLTFVTGPKATTADNTQTIVVALKSGSGKTVTTATSDITLAVSSGGVLVGTLTVSAVNGIATFAGIQETTAGKMKFTVSDSEDGNLSTTSKAITIKAGTASQLVIVSQPTEGVPGTSVSPLVVDVEDAFGNVVTTGKATAVTASATGGGLLSGTTVEKTKQGVATFKTLSVSAVGTYTLTADATLSTGATATVTSADVDVVAAATRIVLTTSPASSSHSAGTAFQIVAALEDSTSVVTADNTPITVSIVAGTTGGKLKGTTTITPTDGVASFNNLSLTKTGTYSLLVTSGNRSVEIDNVTITAGSAKKLVIASIATGTSTTLGDVTVDVDDANGNLVTTDQSTVTLTVYQGTLGAKKTVTLGSVIGPTSVFSTTATASGGVASFTSLTTSLASGFYSVVVTDGGLQTAFRTVFIGNVGLG